MTKSTLLVLSLFLAGTGQPLLAQKTQKAPASKVAAKNTKEVTPEQVLDEPARTNLPAFDSTLAPNDALTASLKKMVRLMGAVENAVVAVDNILDQQQSASSDPATLEFYKRFKQEYKSERVRRLLENLLVKMYRKYYTLEEVEELVQFYSTPVGRKTLSVLPLVIKEGQVEGGKLGELIAAEIMKKMSEQ